MNLDTTSAGYDKETGLPKSKKYLECDLPPYLQSSLENMVASWKIVDSGKKDLHWDLYWCELNADINSAEVDIDEAIITVDNIKLIRFTKNFLFCLLILLCTSIYMYFYIFSDIMEQVYLPNSVPHTTDYPTIKQIFLSSKQLFSYDYKSVSYPSFSEQISLFLGC